MRSEATKQSLDVFSLRMLLIASILSFASQPVQATSIISSHDEDTQNLIRQNQLEKEGRILEKQGKFDEAIAKYQQAVAFDLQIYGSDKGRPYAFIAEVHHKQNKFDEALKEVEALLEAHPGQQSYIDWQFELLALIQSRDTGSPEPLYGHIQYLREKYQEHLPPQSYGGYGDTVFSTMIRLYDHIEDYDAGIALVDEFLEYGYSRNKDYVRVKSSSEALQHGYKAAAEFLKIRESFLQDKSENRPSCVSAKPGAVCLGRAAKALIQSDYFPW